MTDPRLRVDDFAYELPGIARFRANAFVDRKGNGAVFRVIPTKIMTAADLGLSPHILQLGRLNQGLVLVTGPTGSGKTTTLYSFVRKLNTPDRNIVTIEDPVEIRLPMLRQQSAYRSVRQ